MNTPAGIPSFPICGDGTVPVEAALNRPFWKLLGSWRGSARLQIRLPGGDWKSHMTIERSAQGLYCPTCGSLTIAPSLPDHREALGLDSE